MSISPADLDRTESKTISDRLLDNLFDGSVGRNVDECWDFIKRHFGDRYDLREHMDGFAECFILEILDEVELTLAREDAARPAEVVLIYNHPYDCECEVCCPGLSAATSGGYERTQGY